MLLAGSSIDLNPITFATCTAALPTLLAPSQTNIPCLSDAVYAVLRGMPIVYHPAYAVATAMGSKLASLKVIPCGSGTALAAGTSTRVCKAPLSGAPCMMKEGVKADTRVPGLGASAWTEEPALSTMPAMSEPITAG